MSDRVESKLQDVVIASYRYRHEAEFAAGFLDDAGIPFRLQIDDPALGVMVAAPATLWVRRADVRRAREVLELPDPRREGHDPSPGPSAPRSGTSAVRRIDAASLDRPSGGSAGRIDGRRLSARERLLAAAGAAGLAGVGLALPDAAGVVARLAPPLGAGLLLGVAVLGRAPAIVRRILGALSGNAP